MSEQMCFGNGSTRADQVFERFVAFHKGNPLIWAFFQTHTTAMRVVRRRYSAYSVMGHVRWNIDITTKGDDVKINNDFIPYYARMYMAKYPEASAFFELRHRTTQEKPGYRNDIGVYHTGPAGDETVLMNKLKELADQEL